jgi:hypothetical protein
MKTKIVLLSMGLILASCNSGTGVDFCKYANKKPLYQFLLSSQEIKSCTVLEKKEHTEKIEGHKATDYRVKLELEITYAKDDCMSEQDMRCGLTGDGCLKDKEGKRLDACAYPDKRVEHSKGETKKLVRNLHLIDGDGEVSVISNNEVK